MNNHECKARLKTIFVNNNEPVFYPYGIRVNKCSGNCNNINDAYARLCVPDIIKNINVKVFNLMQRITRQYKSCSMKLVNVCVDKLQAFAIIGKDGTKASVDVSVRNQLTKKYLIKDLFGIQVL